MLPDEAEMTSDSSAQHKAIAAQQGPVAMAIVTVSDTRTPETDANARYLREQIAAAGHRVVAYHLIKDEPDEVARVLDELVASEARVILFNGGTGIAPRDTTFDVLSRRLEKTMPGFGELFRMLSYSQVGAAAMLSRATAGVYHNKVIISTPGSPAAVQLAWEKLIAPELEHLAWEVTR
jgi:molybdenum cofactor biosynthesis protein B